VFTLKNGGARRRRRVAPFYGDNRAARLDYSLILDLLVLSRPEARVIHRQAVRGDRGGLGALEGASVGHACGTEAVQAPQRRRHDCPEGAGNVR
jgi:hypothetical protein